MPRTMNYSSYQSYRFFAEIEDDDGRIIAHALSWGLCQVTPYIDGGDRWLEATRLSEMVTEHEPHTPHVPTRRILECQEGTLVFGLVSPNNEEMIVCKAQFSKVIHDPFASLDAREAELLLEAFQFKIESMTPFTRYKIEGGNWPQTDKMLRDLTLHEIYELATNT